jgi:hypothetical protein
LVRKLAEIMRARLSHEPFREELASRSIDDRVAGASLCPRAPKLLVESPPEGPELGAERL